MKLWLGTWFGFPDLRPMVRQAWPQVVRCLQNIIPSQFARQVRGPMGALIGYLLEVGWTPTSPTEWTAPGDEGAHWIFPGSGLTGFEDTSEVLDEFQQSFQDAAWAKAAQHYCGEGSAHGVDNA
eukprot:7449163-Pyramimonas_sp.AAC.1